MLRFFSPCSVNYRRNMRSPLSVSSLLLILLYENIIFPVKKTTAVSTPGTNSSTISSSSFPPIDFANCGKSYNCFRKPINCSSVTSCDAFAIFQYDKEKQVVLIQIATKHVYIAFGQNPRADAYMVKIRGQYCFKDKPIQFGNFHGNDLTYNDIPTWVEKVEGIDLIETLIDKDDVLICKYARIITPTPGNEQYMYDFNETLYTLMAFGTSISGSKPAYHDNNYIVSSEKINYLSNITNGANGKIALAKYKIKYLHKIHGFLMIIGYVILATAGILTSCFLKRVTSKIKVKGMDAWFPVHVFLVLLCLVFVVSGFITIIVEKHGWSPTAGNHHYTGLFAVIAFLAQPLMGFARPPHGNKWRWVFNGAHCCIGMTGWLLGTFAIMFAFQLLDQSIILLIVFIMATIILCVSLASLIREPRKTNNVAQEKTMLLMVLPFLMIFAFVVAIYSLYVIFSL